MYRDKTNPVTKIALRTQLNYIAKITNYYDDLSNFYLSQTGEIFDEEQLKDIVEYSHIETLFIIFTAILDWEHQRKSIFFPTDESKGEILKKFLSSLADSNIKNLDDVLKLEEKITDFIDTIEFFFDYYFQ